MDVIEQTSTLSGEIGIYLVLYISSSPSRGHFEVQPSCSDVEPSQTVRDLGAFFDQAISMKERVNRLVKTCNFQLPRVRSIRRSLPMIVEIQLVNSFVISRLTAAI